MSTPASSRNPRRPIGRRGFLGLALGGAVGTAAGLALPQPAYAADPGDLTLVADDSTVPFYGVHQAGIATPAPAQATLLAFTLRPGTDRAALGRLLRVWTGTIEALMAGRPAPGDPTPDLSAPGTALTVTVGVGPRTIARAGRAQQQPDLVVPPFPIDQLEKTWSGGDLVVQVCADDATSVAHACRMLARDAAPFALPAWRQTGFNGARPDGTMRNLLGHVEGPGNPAPGTATFDATVWRDGDGPDWFVGGTTMVVRRIRMGLDAWERLTPVAQDQVIGRRTSNGAPRGQANLDDVPDFEQIDTEGDGTHVHSDGSIEAHPKGAPGPAIPENAHIRRAHAAFNDGRTIFRRGWSYSDAADDHGQVFVSFQADLEAYVTIQNSLAALDALNAWTTPIGSAAFAVLPGCAEGDWLGRALIES